MPVSKALKKSARDFCIKYACNFDFATFESRVEDFTFLRPVGGWIDAYKAIFERMYKNTLERAADGAIDNLDGEAMLDDFEYTLIRPYVNESKNDIKHKPYAGMDRIARLEYLDRLTKEAPSNPVDLYTEKYKRGELSIKQMKSASDFEEAGRERYVKIAGYAQALENINKSRSFLWRAFHPFRNSAEKRDSASMKRRIIEESSGGETAYTEFAAAANEPFKTHLKANALLEHNMARALEDLDMKQKMSDAMRESLRIEELEIGTERESSRRVEVMKAPLTERQI